MTTWFKRLLKRTTAARTLELRMTVSVDFDTVDFEPFDSIRGTATPYPTEEQLRAFLMSKGTNIVLSEGQTLSMARRTIPGRYIMKPPNRTWLHSIIYELTGVKFAKVIGTPEIIVANVNTRVDGKLFHHEMARVKFTFVLNVQRLGEQFNRPHTNVDDIESILRENMEVRAEKSISQQVYFHYWTRFKLKNANVHKYAQAYLSRVTFQSVELGHF
jgi:hypothetical protein